MHDDPMPGITSLRAAQVQTVAGHAFAELVERAAACDRIRGVLALLKRYDHLFRLPMRIRHASERGLYDQASHSPLSSRLPTWP